MNRKSFLLLGIVCAFFAFLTPTMAREVETTCEYYNASNNNYIGMNVYFYDDGTIEGSHYYDGHTITPPSKIKKFEQASAVFDEYRRTKTCPKYVLSYQSVNPFQIALAVDYHLLYRDSDRDYWVAKAGMATTVNWAPLKTSSKPNEPEEVPKDYETLSRVYSLRANSSKKVTFSIQYNSSNGYYRNGKLKYSDVSKKPAMVFKSVSMFQTTILNRAQKREWPMDLYCGTISVTMGLKSHEVIYHPESRSVKNGDYVCTFDRNLFQGTDYERYVNNDGYLYTPDMTNDDDEEEEKPDNNNNNNNSKPNVKPSPGNDNDIIVNDTNLGMVCKSSNLKTPLKYIGWILTALKIIIPIVIISLGVMDLMKAVASQKQDELSKALKTILVRLIAGVIIFLVPTIINFLFTLVDDWNDYESYYSECTKCLVNPKDC